jgi:hypothetical protein
VQRDEPKNAAPAAPSAAATAAAAPVAAAPAGATVSMRIPSGSLRLAVARRASSFRQQHFQAGSEAAGLESDGLQKLRQLCNQLGQDNGSCVAELLEVRGQDGICLPVCVAMSKSKASKDGSSHTRPASMLAAVGFACAAVLTTLKLFAGALLINTPSFFLCRH